MTPTLFDNSFDQWPGRIVRKLRRKYNDHCTTILTYHSISRDERYYNAAPGIRHAPADFEREMDYLAEHYNIISLRELAETLNRGDQPRRAVVITFDDGYADNILQAWPILFRRRIPMTIFPVASVIGNHDLMWQHKLAWLTANGHEDRVWHEFRRRGWPVPQTPENLHDYTRLSFRMDLPLILEETLHSVGTSGAELADAHRPYITEEDISRADPAYVEFGNHTDTHPVLAALTAGQQMAEIAIARRKLHELLGRPPTAFAYPFGLKRHFNDTTRRIVADAGHQVIVDMRRRMNVGVISPLDLSRRPAPCGSQIEFEKSIEAWPANAHLAPPEVLHDAPS